MHSPSVQARTTYYSAMFAAGTKVKHAAIPETGVVMEYVSDVEIYVRFGKQPKKHIVDFDAKELTLLS